MLVGCLASDGGGGGSRPAEPESTVFVWLQIIIVCNMSYISIVPCKQDSSEATPSLFISSHEHLADSGAGEEEKEGGEEKIFLSTLSRGSVLRALDSSG